MRPARPRSEYLARLCLLVGGTFAGLILLEAALAVLQKDIDRFHIWTPGKRATFHTVAGTMPGVTGTAYFSANSDGMRAEEPSPDHEFKILAVGGSTTECLFLDQSEAWPHLLQENLRKDTGKRVFVGNVGRSGHNSRDHYFQVKYLLEQHSDFDLVILLVGINDLSIRISDPSYSPLDFDDPDQREEVIRRAFEQQPLYEEPRRSPFYENTRVWKALEILTGERERVKDNAGVWYVKVRGYRHNAETIVDDLPDIQTGLDEYERNINKIIDITSAKGVELILVTQPVMWHADISGELEDLIWFGGIGRFTKGEASVYYSARALAETMNSYNAELLSICEAKGVECLDLAAMLPRDTSSFFDDVHFNEAGARSVARLLADRIVVTPRSTRDGRPEVGASRASRRP